MNIIRKLNRKKNILLRETKISIIKKLFDRKNNKEPVDLSSVKSILFLCKNKLGDTVISTMYYKAAKNAGYHVTVVAAESVYAFLQPNPHIDAIYPYKNTFINVIKMGLKLRKKRFDLLIDADYDLHPNKILLLSLISPRYLMGINKTQYKIFDISLTDTNERSNHVSSRYIACLEYLGIKNNGAAYDLHIPKDIENEVIDYLSPYKKVLVINPFSGSRHRDMSAGQLSAICKSVQAHYPELQIILIGIPERLEKIKIENVMINKFNTLMHSVALIKYASVVLSPDTSIVHMANAFNKPLLALYIADNVNYKELNSKVWGPNYDLAHILYCNGGDISTLNADVIYNKLTEVIDSYIWR